MTWTPRAAARNSSPRCTRTCAGSVCTGAKAPTSAARLPPTIKASACRALTAPHAGEEEPIYPGTCRNASPHRPRAGVNWRFRVTAGESNAFTDPAVGPHTETAGHDFGDFLVWRKDDLPSYQLACTVDDDAMRVTEVVRGADLLTSTCRQLLLYRALGLTIPTFYHCPLVLDEQGQRLAKRHDALSLRTLRERGALPETLRPA